MLRLIKRHTKQCQQDHRSAYDRQIAKKKSSKDYKSLSEKDHNCNCHFTIIGPHPKIRGERYKKTLQTANKAIALHELREIETDLFLKPEEAAKTLTLSQAVAKFQQTKNEKSKERQNKIKRVLVRQTIFLAQHYGIIDADKAKAMMVDRKIRGKKADTDKEVEAIGEKILITRPGELEIDGFLLTFVGKLSVKDDERSTVKGFWSYCFEKGFISRNIAKSTITFGTPRERELLRKQRRPTFSREEMTALMTALENYSGPHCQDHFSL